jgi:nucleotide-binding universal stress UspA family protein
MRAVEMAVELSMRDGSKLTLVHVVMPPIEGVSEKVLEEMRKAGTAALDLAEEKCQRFGLTATRILRVVETHRTSIAYEILKIAVDGRYDCVILGSRGYAGERGILMGSVGVSLAISLPCTTIIVR